MKKITLYLPIHDRQHCRPRFLTNFSTLPHSYQKKNLHHSHSLSNCKQTDSKKSNRKYQSCIKSERRPLIQMSVHKINKISSLELTQRIEKKRPSIEIRAQQLNTSQPSLLIKKLQRTVKTQRAKTQAQSLTEIQIYRNIQINDKNGKFQNLSENEIRIFHKRVNSNEKQLGVRKNLNIPFGKQKYYSRKINVKLNNIKIDQLLNMYLTKMENNHTHK